MSDLSRLLSSRSRGSKGPGRDVPWAGLLSGGWVPVNQALTVSPPLQAPAPPPPPTHSWRCSWWLCTRSWAGWWGTDSRPALRASEGPTPARTRTRTQTQTRVRTGSPDGHRETDRSMTKSTWKSNKSYVGGVTQRRNPKPRIQFPKEMEAGRAGCSRPRILYFCELFFSPLRLQLFTLHELSRRYLRRRREDVGSQPF